MKLPKLLVLIFSSMVLTACGGGSSNFGNAASSSTGATTSSVAPPAASSSVGASSAQGESSSVDATSSSEAPSSVANSSEGTGVSSDAPSSEAASSSEGEASSEAASSSEEASSSEASSSSEEASSSEAASSSSEPAIENTDLPIHEDFDGVVDADGFFSVSYKALATEEAPFYFNTAAGTPVFNDGAMQLANGRFTLGNTTPAVSTASDNTATTGELDLSQPYRISFCVKASNGAGNLVVYVDNNTTSQGASIHGNPSRITNQALSGVSTGQRYVINASVGSSTSFIQLRVDSSGDLTIDDLWVGYQSDTSTEPGPETCVVVPGEPVLSIDNSEAEELTVTWAAVDHADSYTLRYGEVNDVDDVNLTELASVTSPYVIDNLDDDTTYYVFVRANNNVGSSDWASESATTINPALPPAVPAAPQLTAGDSQLTVTWEAVAGAASYNVVYNTSDSAMGATQVPGDLTGTTVTIPDLTNGTTYYVFVRANNDSGSSSYSPSANAVPAEVLAQCFMDSFDGDDLGTMDTNLNGDVISFEWSTRADISYDQGRLKSTANQRGALGFFTPNGESISLSNVGDRIRLSADFTYATTVNDSDVARLRIALVQSVANPNATAHASFVPSEDAPNTNARPVAGSQWGTDGRDWAALYQATMGTIRVESRSGNRAVPTPNIALYERNQTNNEVLGGSNIGSGYTQVASGGDAYNAGPGYVNEDMNLELIVELVDAETVDMTLTYRHQGAVLTSITQTNHATTNLSFDSVGIFFRLPGYEFEHIVVEHLPVGKFSVCPI